MRHMIGLFSRAYALWPCFATGDCILPEITRNSTLVAAVITTDNGPFATHCKMALMLIILLVDTVNAIMFLWKLVSEFYKS